MPISNQELRKAGLKVTFPRIKILELLENSKQHHLVQKISIKLYLIRVKMWV